MVGVGRHRWAVAHKQPKIHMRLPYARRRPLFYAYDILFAEMIVYDILQTATAFDGKYYTPTQINLKNAGKEYQFTVDEEGVITKQKI